MNPLVSCILPTRGRGELARQAVECFASQTYLNRELIILDDLNDRSFPNGLLGFPEGRFIYLMHESRSIPQKRNLCCSYAKGDVVAHIDSDDFSAPERIAGQVQRLQESSKSVSGFHSMTFVDQDGRFRKYHGGTEYALGTSLMYQREYWQQHPFKENLRTTWGEDNAFVSTANDAKQLISVDAGLMMLARVHSGNTSPKYIHQGMQYRDVSAEEIEHWNQRILALTGIQA